MIPKTITAAVGAHIHGRQRQLLFTNLERDADRLASESQGAT